MEEQIIKGLVPVAQNPEKQNISKNTLKQKTMKNFKPDYSEDKIANLQEITFIAEKEIIRINNDEKLRTFPYGENGCNCMLNITEAMNNGFDIVTPEVNRLHGKDLQNTGASLRIFGAQQPVLFITKRVADIAGMKVVRFTNDKKQDAIDDDAIVVIDGNGRINYLLSLDAIDRPTVFGTFITKDALGYYNPAKVMEVINTERLMWKTQDMVQKRLLEEGNNAHEGWGFIQDLLKKGYKYQAACQIATLGNDRIKKREATSGKAEDIFVDMHYSKQIFQKLKEKIGEGEDKTLKTKAFTQIISALWKRMLNKNSKEDATNHFVTFIASIPSDKVTEIISAQGKDKDARRVEIINDLFNDYLKDNEIEL